MKTSLPLLMFAAFGAAVLSSGAYAQGVPITPGVYGCNGAAQAGPCQPSSGSSSSGSSSTRSSVPDAPYEAAPVKWVDRWGAIASDGRGTAGIVANLSSKMEAEHSAISECKSRGGGACAVQLLYHNQCVAVIAGTSGANNVHAPTKEEAIALGMKGCETVDGQGSCRVYYSGCSYPARVQ